MNVRQHCAAVGPGKRGAPVPAEMGAEFPPPPPPPSPSPPPSHSLARSSLASIHSARSSSALSAILQPFWSPSAFWISPSLCLLHASGPTMAAGCWVVDVYFSGAIRTTGPMTDPPPPVYVDLGMLCSLTLTQSVPCVCVIGEPCCVVTTC